MKICFLVSRKAGFDYRFRLLLLMPVSSPDRTLTNDWISSVTVDGRAEIFRGSVPYLLVIAHAVRVKPSFVLQVVRMHGSSDEAQEGFRLLLSRPSLIAFVVRSSLKSGISISLSVDLEVQPTACTQCNPFGNIHHSFNKVWFVVTGCSFFSCKGSFSLFEGTERMVNT